ncbi:chemotaxis protein CheW [Methylophaga sp. OBS1]|jgi:chemosensory pili system protein ChpC|uniref:chemotaxis protein CheW n=1 Tax=Methylophaga sp. OBS1 TaxID=2991933 RepID=UPI0022577103|nr:chemotaxis protein CheW [Methylophaga sp. OBS1]MCX4192654.1 chemotaxis protein CheW [Methylophaga sp. OBS1]
MTAQPEQAQFVHCMLIPLQQHYLLLPNSSISEVIPRTGIVQELAGDASWLSFIDWQQQRLPLVYLETLLTDGVETQSAGNKLCIINGINPDADIEFYAIPCSGSPQLITLNQAALHLTQDSNNSPYLHCQIKISNKVALIPNLDQIEASIRDQQG